MRDEIFSSASGPPLGHLSYRPRYRPPAAEAHGLGLTKPPMVSATAGAARSAVAGSFHTFYRAWWVYRVQR